MAKSKNTNGAIPPLTARQREFCEQYVADLNATQAAIRAGYSAHTANRTAHELLAKPQVAQRVAELRAARSERTRIDADFVLNNLREIVERCMAADQFKPMPAIRALELVARHLGLLAADRLELSGTVSSNVKADVEWTANDRRDPETAKLARALAARMHATADPSGRLSMN